jgi:hypothetical protein
MFLVSFDRAEVPTHTERGSLLLKFSFCAEFFHFRISVSRSGSWSQSGAKGQDIFLLFLHKKLIRATDSTVVKTLSTGF